MNLKAIHSYHLIVLILLANIWGVAPVTLQAMLPMASSALVVLLAGLTFGATLLPRSRGRKVALVATLLLLTALTLARLLEGPALATLVATLCCIILFSQDKDCFLRAASLAARPRISGYRLLLSWGVAALICINFLRVAAELQQLLFAASHLAFTSVLIQTLCRLSTNGATRGLRFVGFGMLLVGGAIAYLGDADHYVVAAIGLMLLTLPPVILLLNRSTSLEQVLTNNRLFRQPEILIMMFFAGLALFGALCLQMPFATRLAQGPQLIDALFTAVSAICVTGLNVLDPAVDFSFAGQVIILILIQLGGIGIVSMSAWVLFFFSDKRLSIAHEQTISELSASRHNLTPRGLIKRVLGYFMAFEVIGALLLVPLFTTHGDTLPEAVWRAIFTSISAFCNGGFALQSQSLIPYQSDPAILGVISFLIIAGGFAPLVMLRAPWRRFKHWQLQDKISVVTTGILLGGGGLLMLILEWHHTLSGLGFFDKLVNAWFQSVTTRTAGFNSIEMGQLQDVTMVFFMALMFIGGNPGSAAGGIKTTTIAVLGLAAFAVLRGEREVRIFNRSIDSAVIFKAIATFGVGLLMGFGAFMSLAMTQKMATVPLLFETVSALGTVGLSTGGTANLDEVGRVIIMVCMFMGRVGPLTFALLLLRRSARSRWLLPKEEVYVS